MLVWLARRYHQVYPVFIRQGLVWEETELRHLRRFLRAALVHVPRSRLQALTILSVPVRDLYGNHWSTTGRRVPGAATPDEAVYLPGRNLLLLSKAAVFCAPRRIGTIAIGSLGHNPFPDATPKFFRLFCRTASEALSFKCQIITPFRSLSKEQVIRRGDRLKTPFHLSFSCLAPRHGFHCGRCNKCAERQRAFRKAGVKDQTKYVNQKRQNPQ